MGRLGTGLLVAVACAGGLFPWLFDANATHMFNPDWSSHARLHDAIAVITATGAGLLGAALLLAPAVRADRVLLSLAAAVGTWPWSALLLAGLVPGTSYGNPALGTESFAWMGLTLAAPALAAAAFLLAGAVGYALALGGPRR